MAPRAMLASPMASGISRARAGRSLCAALTSKSNTATVGFSRIESAPCAYSGTLAIRMYAAASSKVVLFFIFPLHLRKKSRKKTSSYTYNQRR